jgi:hypothetical protein
MLSPVKLALRILPGSPGWAACSIRSGDHSVEVGPFSHALTDGIDNLVRATVSIVCGYWEAETFSMDNEPQPRWQWHLKRELRGYGPARRAELDVTITKFDDTDTIAGNQVFRVTCDPDDFGRAVLSAMQLMMTSEPPQELHKRWSRFPNRATAALAAALSTPTDNAIS